MARLAETRRPRPDPPNTHLAVQQAVGPERGRGRGRGSGRGEVRRGRDVPRDRSDAAGRARGERRVLHRAPGREARASVCGQLRDPAPSTLSATMRPLLLLALAASAAAAAAGPPVSASLLGPGWSLVNANGSVFVDAVTMPTYALAALQDAGAVGNPLYR